jgi:hypothetical protein
LKVKVTIYLLLYFFQVLSIHPGSQQSSLQLWASAKRLYLSRRGSEVYPVLYLPFISSWGFVSSLSPFQLEIHPYCLLKTLRKKKTPKNGIYSVIIIIIITFITNLYEAFNCNWPIERARNNHDYCTFGL